jgi:hypothetical protein
MAQRNFVWFNWLKTVEKELTYDMKQSTSLDDSSLRQLHCSSEECNAHYPTPLYNVNATGTQPKKPFWVCVDHIPKDMLNQSACMERNSSVGRESDATQLSHQCPAGRPSTQRFHPPDLDA